ncbi:hypothetical protein BGW36DRAFT_430451 [Talaromyces proteolyticus]|uniref:BZIP domain-containing protein n=1 Tax=Talaromyces proteolyticus TaxID=1131652 RepID=A0AAD4KJU6_9EURO|nr:uncharacterized protein BGW36DRAFT_430451 [Talaromyces proteolyticus]KAH8692698.1 hypothetical protein BGW36DRAFT_430451 [Talaromyces proteolyticus]
MVSMVDAGALNDNDISMDVVVPKTEPAQDGHAELSSSVSTPEPEEQQLAQDAVQTQKRKGGRKPIYATSEERKQRNRQAQAAFRERRTEYIKQLETTIKRNEESLQSLQQSHRSAADECLMLRYKNSLLERILLEKGIDVQTELRLKTGSTSTIPPPGKSTPLAPKQPASLERAAIGRTSAQRHGSGSIAPKPDQPQQRDGAFNTTSPQPQPTPSSHVSSPSTGKSPGFALQGAISPKNTEFQAQQQQRARPPLLPQPRDFAQQQPMGMPQVGPMDPYGAATQSMMSANTMASRMPSYYATPFQKHYDQLGKSLHPEFQLRIPEYDAQADMLDDTETAEDGHNANTYVHDFNRPPVPSDQNRMNLSGTSALQTGDVDHGMYGAGGSLFSQYEPVLDSDTFGLSASMHFQTPFSYEQENLRH